MIYSKILIDIGWVTNESFFFFCLKFEVSISALFLIKIKRIQAEMNDEFAGTFNWILAGSTTIGWRFSFERETAAPARSSLKARGKEIKTNRLCPGFRGLLEEGGRSRVILNICKVFILPRRGKRVSSCFTFEGWEGETIGTLEHPWKYANPGFRGGGRKYGMIFVSSSHPDIQLRSRTFVARRD